MNTTARGRGCAVILCLAIAACSGAGGTGVAQPAGTLAPASTAPATPPARDMSRPKARPTTTVKGASYLPVSRLVVALPKGWSSYTGSANDPDAYNETDSLPRDVLAHVDDLQRSPLVVYLYERPCDARIPDLFRSNIDMGTGLGIGWGAPPPSDWTDWNRNRSGLRHSGSPRRGAPTLNIATSCRQGARPLRVDVRWSSDRRIESDLNALLEALTAAVEKPVAFPWAPGGRAPLTMLGVDVAVTSNVAVATSIQKVPRLGWSDGLSIAIDGKPAAVVVASRWGSCDGAPPDAVQGAVPAWFPPVTGTVLVPKTGPSNTVMICRAGDPAEIVGRDPKQPNTLFMIQFEPTVAEARLREHVAPMLASLFDAIAHPAPLALESAPHPTFYGIMKLLLDDGWQWDPDPMVRLEISDGSPGTLRLRRMAVPFRVVEVRWSKGACERVDGDVEISPSPWALTTAWKRRFWVVARREVTRKTGALCVEADIASAAVNDPVTARLVARVFGAFPSDP